LEVPTLRALIDTTSINQNHF